MTVGTEGSQAKFLKNISRPIGTHLPAEQRIIVLCRVRQTTHLQSQCINSRCPQVSKDHRSTYSAVAVQDLAEVLKMKHA